MKKYLLILSSLFFISIASRAQFSKGSILLGGQLSFTTSNYNNSNIGAPSPSNNAGTFVISAGKAIHENDVMGVDISYGFSNNGVLAPNYTDHFYSLGIFYRKYKALGKEFFLFGQVGAAYSGSRQTGSDSTGIKIVTGTTDGGGIYFYPGIAYKISNKLFLELTVPALFSMTYTTVHSPNGSQNLEYNQFSVTTSLNTDPLTALGLGFRLVL
jgi:hypothetical protein